MTETQKSRGDTNLSQISSVTTSKNPPGRDDDGKEPPEQQPKTARRAFLTKNACRRCQQKKSKCDGRRPTCSRCERYTTECTYGVAQEGLTRKQNLQQQLDSKTADHGRLQEIFRAMKEGTEKEATALVAQLRLNVGIGDLLLFAQSFQIPSLSSTSGLPAMAQPPRSTDDSLPAQLQNNYLLASHSAHTSGWDTSTDPDWSTWTQGTGEPSIPHLATFFQDETQYPMDWTASQSFQPFANGEGQYHQQLDMMGGQAQQPNMLNWQVGLSLQQYPPMPQSRDDGQLSQIPSLGQMEERQYQGEQFEGAMSEDVQSQIDRPGSGQSQPDQNSGLGPSRGKSSDHPT